MGLGRDFLRFWLGQSVSLVGTQVTALALPLTAVLVLGAGPGEMGLLGAASFLPFVLVTLPAGAWLDRHRRRPALIAADLGRAILIGVVPVAFTLGMLRFELLLAVAFGVGVLTVVFDIGYLAHVPSLVEPDRLAAANARIVASSSAAQVAGPGVGGALVSLLTAPVALVADAISYLVSAVAIATITRQEPEPSPPSRQDLRREVLDGLRLTFGNRILRAFAAEAASYNALEQVILAVLILFAVRDLGLTPTVLGLTMSFGAVGSLAGSVVAGRVADRVGIGLTIVASELLACAAPLLLPFASGPLIIGASMFLGGFGVAISNVHVVTVRQSVTPDDLLARMNASYRTLAFGAIPVGALIGGTLGELIGLRSTLLVGALAMLAAPLWVIRSPVMRIRALSDAGAYGAAALERVQP
jgi:MFS family permease